MPNILKTITQIGGEKKYEEYEDLTTYLLDSRDTIAQMKTTEKNEAQAETISKIPNSLIEDLVLNTTP